MSAAVSREPVGGFLSPALPRVLAHRGLALDAPENTLPAFAAALAHGAQHLETDVHASRDGVAVLSHDPDLSRLGGTAVRVDALDLADLARVDLGDGHRIPTLAAALEAFPAARFNIDIKADTAMQPTVDAVLAAGASHRVLITSFNGRRRRAALRQVPGAATSASVGQFAAALAAAKLGAAPLARWILRDVDAVQVPERQYGIRIITPRMLLALKSARLEVHVWTVNDVVDMGRLLDLGVDALVTDRADLAMQLLRERSESAGRRRKSPGNSL